jgi:hypothetical protein
MPPAGDILAESHRLHAEQSACRSALTLKKLMRRRVAVWNAEVVVPGVQLATFPVQPAATLALAL